MNPRDEQDPAVHRRGRLYLGLLVILIAAVLALAASSLYVTAGGQLLGLGSQAFGLTATDGLTRSLRKDRDAAWVGRHDKPDAASALSDSARIAHMPQGPTSGAVPQSGPTPEADARTGSSGTQSPREIALERARASARDGRYVQAEDQYRQVLALRDDAGIRLELARMLINAGRNRSAVSELRRILQERPDPKVRRELAIALERDGQQERAAGVLLDLVEDAGETRDLESLARVHADAERYGEAALVLERLESRLGGSEALRMRRARYLWWSGQLRSADAVLTLLLAESGPDPEAYALREEIRRGLDPSVELARRWVERDDTPANRLRLARALSAADRPGRSIEHYALALDAANRDLLDEAVGAAEAADSLDAAIRFLDRHIEATGIEDADLLLKRARLESWAGRPDRAEIAYRRFLALDPADIEARFSLARQLAWQDSSRWAEAEAELKQVLDADDEHVGALLLLADLERWRGEAEAALALYERVLVLDPDAAGLAEGMRVARELLDPGQAPADITRVAWTVAADSYRDSEGFDWVLSRLTRDYTYDFGTVSIGLRQGYSSGPSLSGWDRRAFAAGVDVLTRIPLGAGYAAVAAVGAMAFEGTPVTATWGAGVEYRAEDGRAVLRYDRSPGLREAGRFTALESEAVLDRISLSGSGAVAGWNVSGQGQWQRFGSTAGAGTRYAAMLRSDRSIGETPLTLGGMIRAITAVDPAPTAGSGGLYWSPRSYIAPALTFGYGRSVGSRWWIGLRAAPGYAWIDERETGLVRYRDGSTPTLEAGGTIGYRNGPWTIDLSADGGGALRSGYTSHSVSIQVSRTGGF
ncbi:MAG: tetratricopeptide repeat protein [Candidatus Longimicrobiales bacterium M2_2A_002]